MEVIDLFKVPILRGELNLNNDNIISKCLELKKQSAGRMCSNVCGWQSNNIDKNLEEFNELFNKISDISLEFSNFLKLNLVGEISFWVNINKYRDFNERHIHPNCVLSGVYYVKCPKNSGEIVFHHPSPNIEYDWVSQLNYNNHNSIQWKIDPEEGDFILFPSWLHHHVNPNLNDEEDRISISFNVR
jgi:uncharacterized protein (TIGR02466 family)